MVEKQKRDALNQQYLEVVEQERLYYKTVKDFTEVSSSFLATVECQQLKVIIVNLSFPFLQECHKNEVLLSKLKNLGLS